MTLLALLLAIIGGCTAVGAYASQRRPGRGR
jgi:hypothetical protein